MTKSKRGIRKNVKSRRLSLVMMLMLLVSQLAIPMTSNAAYFYLPPNISQIEGNLVKFTFQGSGGGTCYYAITPYESPDLTQDQILASTPANQTVFLNGAIPDTGGVVSASFSIESGNFDLGGHYKLQAVYKDAQGSSSVVTKGFYKGGLDQGVQISKSYSNGFVQTFKTYAPGTVYTGIFNPTDTVVATSLLNDVLPIKRVYSATTGRQDQALAIREACVPTMVPLGGSGSYKVYSLFVDADEVRHLNSDGTVPSSATLDTRHNALLSVHYDNQVSSDDSDDQITLTFAYPVGAIGSSANFEIELDSQTSVFTTPDISLTYGTGDFSSVVTDENKVKLTLSNVSGKGIHKINSAGIFDNGVMKASVVSPGSMSPKLNASNSSVVALLDQGTIGYADDAAPKLQQFVYDRNATPQDFTDDKFILQFSNLIDGVGNVTLSADDNSLGSYEASEVIFSPASDYTTVLGGSGEVYFQLTPAGAAKASVLVNPMFKIHLDSLTWGSATVDKSIKDAYFYLANGYGRVSSISVDGQAVEGFDPTRAEYSDVSTSYESMAVDSQGGAGAASYIDVAMASNLMPIEIKKGVNDTHATINVYSDDGEYMFYWLYQAQKDFSIKAITVDGMPVAGVSKFGTVYSKTVNFAGTSPVVDIKFDDPSYVLGTNYTQTTSGSLPGVKVYTWHILSEPRAITLTLYSASGGAGGGDERHNGGAAQTFPEVPKNATLPQLPSNPSVVDPKLAPDLQVPLNRQIETASNTFKTLSQATAPPTPIEINRAFGTFNQVMSTTKTMEDLSFISSQMNTLANALLKILGDLAPSSPQPPTQVNGALVSEMTKDMTLLTQTFETRLSQIQDPSQVQTAVSNYVTALHTLKATSGIQAVPLDQSVQDILNRAITISGTVPVQDVGPNTQVSMETIANAINNQNRVMSTIQSLGNNYFGDTDCRLLQREIVLELSPRSTSGGTVSGGGSSVGVFVDSRALSTLVGNQIDQLTISSQGASIGVTSGNFNAGVGLGASMTFGAAPGIPGQTAVDFNLMQGSGAPLTILEPVLLRLNLNQFGMANSPSDQLYLGRYNPVTQSWESVGGRVDEQSQTISTFRSGLSQYTVMKANKTLSMADNSWAKAEINAALNKGIIKNASGFNPKDLMTRGEFASWIANAYGLKASGKKLPFKDVTKGSPYYESVAAVYEAGLIGGKTATTFAPSGTLSADEMAVIIGKTLKKFENKQATDKVKSKYLSALKASDTSSWAAKDKALLAELGIISTQELAKIKGNVTKEMAAAVLMKFYRS